MDDMNADEQLEREFHELETKLKDERETSAQIARNFLTLKYEMDVLKSEYKDREGLMMREIASLKEEIKSISSELRYAKSLLP